MVQSGFRGTSRVFQGNFKEFKGDFSALMLFHDCFPVSSNMFHVFFNVV